MSQKIKQLLMKKQSVQNIKKGNPLITEKDIQNIDVWAEGEIVHLIDAQTKQFLAKALLGKQNRAIGWVFTRQKDVHLDATFFEKVLLQAIQKRDKMTIHSNAYRLFNGESDGLGGLTIDLYDKVAIFSWYTVALYQYAEQIITCFKALMPNCQSIYEKARYEKAHFDTRFVLGVPQDKITISENDVKFSTFMNEGLMTGIFLDQREIRKYLKAHAMGKTVLNTFSYTGAFSIAAAMGGAKQSVSVDVANRSIEKTEAHFALNNISMDNHRCYVMDVFDYFNYAKKKKLAFDWVILDPPSFARTKKRTFSVVKDYKSLLQDAIALTEPNGHIIVSTNAANFSVMDFEKMIDTAFKELEQSYRIQRIFRLPQDFTTLSTLEQTNYLKVYIVQVRK
ncbi:MULTISPECIES: class I SAM-dependent rRNA methyltransferase [unclassified Granulicatella]|uniref:class I SAM-dependent rRNA methyltransferase n=1 Tax=unclassified Granulicatella TaxID=2630493 RepID=UPI0014306933|nr:MULTISPECIES: class I SAM-dependent rRNA methyltransferase [unclassified Granulicatella]MBF0780834.1 class I SAM-dependent rRNA methyltransferase [Granulicatella sp. 19428wC4_WM01]